MTDHEPVPPTNVALVYRDGRRMPVACVYDGLHDGIHRWIVLVPPVDLDTLQQVTADTLPARTSISLEVKGLDP